MTKLFADSVGFLFSVSISGSVSKTLSINCKEFFVFSKLKFSSKCSSVSGSSSSSGSGSGSGSICNSGCISSCFSTFSLTSKERLSIFFYLYLKFQQQVKLWLSSFLLKYYV